MLCRKPGASTERAAAYERGRAARVCPNSTRVRRKAVTAALVTWDQVTGPSPCPAEAPACTAQPHFGRCGGTTLAPLAVPLHSHLFPPKDDFQRI